MILDDLGSVFVYGPSEHISLSLGFRIDKGLLNFASMPHVHGIYIYYRDVYIFFSKT